MCDLIIEEACSILTQASLGVLTLDEKFKEACRLGTRALRECVKDYGGDIQMVITAIRSFRCARHGYCIFQVMSGVCARQPCLIAVDRFGHYGNQAEPTDDYPLSVDLHWCPARGEEIRDGRGTRRGRGRRWQTEQELAAKKEA